MLTCELTAPIHLLSFLEFQVPFRLNCGQKLSASQFEAGAKGKIEWFVLKFEIKLGKIRVNELLGLAQSGTLATVMRSDFSENICGKN